MIITFLPKVAYSNFCQNPLQDTCTTYDSPSYAQVVVSVVGPPYIDNQAEMENITVHVGDDLDVSGKVLKKITRIFHLY